MKKLWILLVVACSVSTLYSQPLRIAVYQYADNPRIKNLLPLAAHLQREAGIAATVKSYPTVHALIAGMQKNEVDLAFISTFGYLLLQAGKTAHPMSTLAALVAPEAKDNYKTVIVCKRKAGINTLEDLAAQGKGLRMVFVAKGSTSGNLVPRLLLSGVQIAAEKHFSSVSYAGTHANALNWLFSDSADVAALGSSEWEKLEATQKQSLQLLALSAEIPLGPVLINQNLDKNRQQKISESLLQLHANDKAALEAVKAAWSEAKQATHFIPIAPSYYEPYLKQFGREEEVGTIIRAFIN